MIKKIFHQNKASSSGSKSNENLFFNYYQHIILQLDTDIEKIKPIKITEMSDEQIQRQSLRQPVLTAGWGTTNDDGIDREQILRKAPLIVIPKKVAEKNFELFKKPTERANNHLCTMNRPPLFIGKGDSGSPLLFKGENGYEVVGVNSHVCPHNNLRHPRAMNVHQSVNYYRQFISDFANVRPPHHDDGESSPPSKKQRTN